MTTLAVLGAVLSIAGPAQPANPPMPKHWTIKQARTEVIGYEHNLDPTNVLGVSITACHWLRVNRKAECTVTTKPTTLLVGQVNVQRYRWQDVAEPNPGGHWYNVRSIGLQQLPAGSTTR